MRISSSLSLLACTIGFLTLLIPVLYDNQGFALTWMDIQETPPLWIFIFTTLIIAAHDIKWVDGIKFIRKSDVRLFRIVLIAIAIVMAYAMELSVNVKLTNDTFWQSAIYFDVPNETNVLLEYSVLYYDMKIVRVFDITFNTELVYSVFSPTNHVLIFKNFAGLGYHLMRACRLILIFALISSFLERSLRISQILQKVDRSLFEKSKP